MSALAWRAGARHHPHHPQPGSCSPEGPEFPAWPGGEPKGATSAPYPIWAVHSCLPQQSEKSWVPGALDSGPERHRSRSPGVRGPGLASCFSSLTGWPGSAVLYRKLVTEDEALGGSSWGRPLGPWPCRPQSREPLVTSETPFSSTSALESRPPSSGNLEGGEAARVRCSQHGVHVGAPHHIGPPASSYITTHMVLGATSS